MADRMELKYSRWRGQVIRNQIYYGRNWLRLRSKCSLSLSQSDNKPKKQGKSSKLNKAHQKLAKQIKTNINEKVIGLRVRISRTVW